MRKPHNKKLVMAGLRHIRALASVEKSNGEGYGAFTQGLGAKEATTVLREVGAAIEYIDQLLEQEDG